MRNRFQNQESKFQIFWKQTALVLDEGGVQRCSFYQSKGHFIPLFSNSFGSQPKSSKTHVILWTRLFTHKSFMMCVCSMCVFCVCVCVCSLSVLISSLTGIFLQCQRALLSCSCWLSQTSEHRPKGAWSALSQTSILSHNCSHVSHGFRLPLSLTVA